jgi:hypothetical protein
MANGNSSVQRISKSRPPRWSVPPVVHGLQNPDAQPPWGGEERDESRTVNQQMTARVLLLGIVVMAAAAPVGTAERLAIRVSPSVAFAPANLIVRAVVESNSENRAIEIVAESGEFYRSSEMELDGEHAPKTTEFQFRSLPVGAYQVSAVLKDVSGRELAYTHVTVTVVSGPTL